LPSPSAAAAAMAASRSGRGCHSAAMPQQYGGWQRKRRRLRPRGHGEGRDRRHHDRRQQRNRHHRAEHRRRRRQRRLLDRRQRHVPRQGIWRTPSAARRQRRRPPTRSPSRTPRISPPAAISRMASSRSRSARRRQWWFCSIGRFVAFRRNGLQRGWWQWKRGWHRWDVKVTNTGDITIQTTPTGATAGTIGIIAQSIWWWGRPTAGFAGNLSISTGTRPPAARSAVKAASGPMPASSMSRTAASSACSAIAASASWRSRSAVAVATAAYARRHDIDLGPSLNDTVGGDAGAAAARRT